MAALQVGSDVNAELLDELKRELSRLLNENSPDGKHISAVLPQIQLEFNLGLLGWYSELPGDYDQNGEVNASDLIPLSRNLGEKGDFQKEDLKHVLDGDGNGEINIGDVVAVARHFGSRISAWNVYRSDDAADYPADPAGANGEGAVLLQTMAFVASTHPEKRYRFTIGPAYDHGSTYWVRPADGQLEGRASTSYTAPSALASDGVWSMQGGDAQRSGRSSVAGPASSALRFSLPCEEGAAEVTFAPDGTAYVQQGSFGRLLAMDSNGRTVWENSESRPEMIPPAVASDGNLYTASDAAELIVIDSNGREQYRHDSGDINSQIFHSPVIGPDNQIYTQFSGGKTFSFNPDGSVDYIHDFGWNSISGPTCTGNGAVIIGIGRSFQMLGKHTFLAFGHTFDDYVFEAPVIGPDRSVYHGSYQAGTFTALNHLLQAEWSVPNPGGSATPPGIAPDGSLRFGSGQADGSGRLHAYTAEGTELWESSVAAAILTSPVVDSLGTSYVSSAAGEVLAIDSDGNELWSFQTGLEHSFSLSISPEGYLYAAGREGGLFVFGERIAPRDFTASDGTYQEEVHLQWTGLPDASGYGIEYRSADGNSPPDWTALYETAGPDATQFSHTPDAPAGNEAAFGNQYDYRVRALYAGADPGPWSDPDSGSMQESWTRWGHDLRNSNQALVDGPDSSHRRWGYSGVTFAHCSPVVAGDGTVYVGSFDSFLYALNPDGSLKWRYQTGDKIGSTAAIGRDGTIYFGSYDGRLYALNPDGKEKWSRGYGNSISSSPVIARNGNIIFTDRGDHVNAMSPEGDYLWSVDATAIIKGAPAVGGDDTIYIGGHDGMLTAISPAGVVKWVFDAPGQIINPPCLGKNGNIYFTCNGGLFALSPSGGKLWEYDGPGIGSYDTLAIDSADNVCLLNGGEFSRISPAGSLLDQLQLTGAPLEPVSLDAAGRIYMGTSTGYIKAFNPDGSEAWQFDMEGECYATPTIGPDGTLYVGSKRGYLYAFGS
ncbi:MAG: PQQ-binding-like beta-propeller repeat protein [bacterium]